MSSSANNVNGTPRGARIIFSIFMVLVYVGVGVCCFCGVFDSWMPQGIAIAMGCLFVVYGLWRGLRLYKGWR